MWRNLVDAAGCTIAFALEGHDTTCWETVRVRVPSPAPREKMATTPKAKVYFFTKYDIVTDRFVRSKRPATLRAIAKVHGTAIKETALEVEKAELDVDGFRKK